MLMDVVRHTDVQRFIDRVTPVLLHHEVYNNALLGVGTVLARDPDFYGAGVPLLYTVESGAAVLLAAFLLPQRKLALAYTERLDALEHLAVALTRDGHILPGVFGPRSVAEHFAQQWAHLHGCRVTTVMDVLLYRLTAVRRPAPVAGFMRGAVEADRPLLVEWFAAFSAEALPQDFGSTAPHIDYDRAVTQWLTDPSRFLVLWEADGPVAVAGATRTFPNNARISVVYTPPQHRRRGYAGALVAALSQAQLDDGRAYCFLSADLHNPTANRIYQSIGYAPVLESVNLQFSLPEPY
jgi:ribosomal protein S18 acetylase RimI-like enzyme